MVCCGAAIVMVQATENIWTRFSMENMVLMRQHHVLVCIVICDAHCLDTSPSSGMLPRIRDPAPVAVQGVPALLLMEMARTRLASCRMQAILHWLRTRLCYANLRTIHRAGEHDSRGHEYADGDQGS